MSNVFTVRNFRLVYFGALVSELGTVLYSFAVSFYILEITDNNAFLQGLIPISSVVAGAVIQLWGSSVLLFMCSAGFAVTTLFMLLSREVGNV